MSNSKSDGSGGNPAQSRSNQKTNLPANPARKVTQGPKGHLQARAIFILKPNFKKKLTTEKNT